MNYIKKKIKGSKKTLPNDDDDFDPASFLPPPVRAPEGAPQGWVPYEERIDEDSEEWQAYKKLTQRVTETLQKTQDNLTKIVATSSVPEGTFNIKTAETEDHEEVILGDKSKSWVNFDDSTSDLDSSISSYTGTPQKFAEKPPRPAPPRPPPPPKLETEVAVSQSAPAGNHIDALEDFLGLGTNCGPPASSTSVLNGAALGLTSDFKHSDDFSLEIDSFGFDEQTNVEDGDDPFDTSFVNVTASGLINADIKTNNKLSEVSVLDDNVQSDEIVFDLEEDDPFTYPEDIGTIKKTEEAGNMNLSFTPYRTRSPNPFLTDVESNSANPFLNGSLAQNLFSSTEVPTTQISSNSKNPFIVSDSQNDEIDLFGVSDCKTTTASFQENSQALDFFSSDYPVQINETVNVFDNKQIPEKSEPILDIFGDLTGPDVSHQLPKQSNSSINIDLLGSDINPDEVKSSTDLFGFNESSSHSTVANELDLFGESHETKPFDLFSSGVPSKQTTPGVEPTIDLFGELDVSSGSFLAGMPTPVSNLMDGDLFPPTRKSVSQMDFKSVNSSTSEFGVDLFLSDIPLSSQSFHSKDTDSLDQGRIKPTENTGRRMSQPIMEFSTIHKRLNEPGLELNISRRKMSQPAMDIGLVTKEMAQTIADIKALSENLDSLFDTKTKNDIKPEVPTLSKEVSPLDPFETFGPKEPPTSLSGDAFPQPMNAFDGLTAPTPKIRIEIPLELKQNADVLEALGQKGPRTPIEPLSGFDLPTPVPGTEDEVETFSFQDTKMLGFEELPLQKEDEEASTHELSDDELPKTLENELHITEDSDRSPPAVPAATDDDFGVSQQLPVSTEIIDSAAFDAFEARFESTSLHAEGDIFDPFAAPKTSTWKTDATEGFGVVDEFDPFLTMTEPPAPPQPSPAKVLTKQDEDSDSDDSGPDFSVFIKPIMRDVSKQSEAQLGPPPVLPPPPKSPARTPTHTSPTSRFNPFNKEPGTVEEIKGPELELQIQPDISEPVVEMKDKKEMQRTESQESAGTPLFEEDDSEPLEEFPVKYAGEGWELMLRQPNKKKITGQRFWKKVFVKLSDHVLQLFNNKEDKDPFQELPLQACYSTSEIGAQQYDTFGKIFTVKLQYVFYKEKVGVRPGQISKVTQGQITSFGQLAKLGLPLEHAPQVSQLLKLGAQYYEDAKIFAREVEEALFRLTVHRDRALTYKTEEIQVTVQDETFADVSKTGHVNNQLARVRVFFLAFISGMPYVELGLNDITKKGKEIVGRHDIIPVVTEEWIRLESVEFHSCVLPEEFDKTRTIKFHPPDACFLELLRFRIRPPKNRELPLQIRATMTVGGNRIEIRSDVLVPGYHSRKHGQVPCEDVAIRFPMPECWIYLFRVEKHFRYGSIKSAARKPGKIKGLERFIGAANTLDPSLIEVSTGQAKYEHQHRAIVWRIPRLPKEGQGAYTEHTFLCRLELTSYDQMPEELAKYINVEFTMPATTVSHTVVRSVSVTNPNPPEKHVRYVSKHEYRVEMEHIHGFAENVYISAAAVSAANDKTSEGSSPSKS